jgi:Disulfide bond formation protein DsbB
MDRRQIAIASALGITVTAIVSALAIQMVGYEPCVLCLRQRIPYYVAIPILAAALASSFAGGKFAGWTRPLMWLGGLCFSVSFVLGVHHVGVEMGWWAGPSSCVTRTFDMSSIDAFAAQIAGTKMVSCNTPSFTLLGFSLAWWNVAVSLVAHIILSAVLVLETRRS